MSQDDTHAGMDQTRPGTSDAPREPNGPRVIDVEFAEVRTDDGTHQHTVRQERHREHPETGHSQTSSVMEAPMSYKIGAVIATVAILLLAYFYGPAAYRAVTSTAAAQQGPSGGQPVVPPPPPATSAASPQTQAAAQNAAQQPPQPGNGSVSLSGTRVAQFHGGLSVQALDWDGKGTLVLKGEDSSTALARLNKDAELSRERRQASIERENARVAREQELHKALQRAMEAQAKPAPAFTPATRKPNISYAQPTYYVRPCN